MSSNNNVRLPNLSLPGTYPLVRFFQFRDGSWTRQDETPGNESHAVGHKLGSFEETDNSAGHKHFIIADKWSYGQGGSSETVEKNDHKVVGGGTVHQAAGDSHSENAGSISHAIGNNVIHVAAGVHFHHATQGTQTTSTGDHVTDHNDGNHHINIEGDHVQFLGGTKYQNIGGEYGLYLPNGNFDVTMSGNGQIQGKNFTVNAGANTLINALLNSNINAGANVVVTANNDIILNCQSLIINVGTGSIVMNGSGLTFTASAINFVQL